MHSRCIFKIFERRNLSERERTSRERLSERKKTAVRRFTQPRTIKLLRNGRDALAPFQRLSAFRIRLVQKLQIRAVQFPDDVRLKYVVVIGDQLPEDVLFVETDAAKTSVFQLGKREVMERVFDVVELVFGELLAAAKGARVERVRGGRFGVHLYHARERRRARVCCSSAIRARAWGKERERERNTIKVVLSFFCGEKPRKMFLLLGPQAGAVSGLESSSGRLRPKIKFICDGASQLIFAEEERPEVGTTSPSPLSLSLHSLLCLCFPEKTKVR